MCTTWQALPQGHHTKESLTVLTSVLDWPRLLPQDIQPAVAKVRWGVGASCLNIAWLLPASPHSAPAAHETLICWP